MKSLGANPFAAAYVIGLARSAERWENMQPVLRTMGIANVRRFEGIDGYALGEEALRQLQDAGELAHDLSGFAKDCALGEMGCALSHAAVLRDVVSRQLEAAVIFEDDIVLAGDPGTWRARAEESLADLPSDWELWYMYRCFDIRHRVKRITSRTVVPWTPQGGAAYAVTLAGARKLLQALEPVANAVDRVYSAVVQKRAVRAFAASPMLILPGAQPSVIHRGKGEKKWVYGGVNRPPEFWPEEYLQHLGEKPFRQFRSNVANVLTKIPRIGNGKPGKDDGAEPIFLVVWGLSRTGGMERHVTEVAVALARRGKTVKVFSHQPVGRRNPYASQMRQAGVQVIAPGVFAVGSEGKMATGPVGRFVSGPLRGPLQSAMRVFHRMLQFAEEARSGHCWTGAEQKLLRQYGFHSLTRGLIRSLSLAASHDKPEVVHVHGCRFGQTWVLQWAHAKGLAGAYTEHTNVADWGGPFDSVGPVNAESGADVLCCVSLAAAASMQAELPRTREIVVCRHIVRSPDAVRFPEEGTGFTRLLCVARLDLHKGIDILLRAAGLLRDAGVDFDLKIAGDGPDRKELQDLAAELKLGDAVTFLGEVPYSRIGELWQEARIGVLASRTEALPLTIVEAMAYGRPMVAARVGGIPEIVSHEENGLLVEPEDAAALAAALRRLLTDKGLTQRLAAGARRSFEEGGWGENDVTDRLMALYGQARKRRDAMEKTRVQGKSWVENQGLATVSTIRSVCHVVRSLNNTGDMEQRIVDQASAVSRAGVTVTAMILRPVSLFNPYVGQMRRAGVRVVRFGVRESVLLGIAAGAHHTMFNAWERAVGIILGTLAEIQADAVHIHGWQGSLRWIPERMAGHRDLSAVATVYSEHSTWKKTPRTTVVAPARVAGDMRVACVVMEEENPARTLAHYFPAGTLEFQCLEEADPEELSRAMKECDAVLLSHRHPHFAIALGEAMALPKPIVLCGDPDLFPIRDGVNGLIASFDDPAGVVAALRKLGEDGLLAEALAHAARRSFDHIDFYAVRVAAEALELYRRARVGGAAYFAG